MYCVNGADGWQRQQKAVVWCISNIWPHREVFWGGFCFEDDGACDGVTVQLFRMMWILTTEVRKKDQDLQATYNPERGGLLRKRNQSLLLQHFISFLSFSWDRDTHICMHTHRHTDKQNTAFLSFLCQLFYKPLPSQLLLYVRPYSGPIQCHSCCLFYAEGGLYLPPKEEWAIVSSSVC